MNYLGPHGNMFWEQRFAWFPIVLSNGTRIWWQHYYAACDYTTWFDGGDWKDTYFTDTDVTVVVNYINEEESRNKLYRRRYSRAAKGKNWGYSEEKKKGLRE